MDEFKKAVSSRHKGTDAHMNSQSIAAHTRPAHVQARWGPNTSGRSRHKVPALTKMLFITDALWQKENKPVFSNVCQWVYQPYSRLACPGIAADTKWTPWWWFCGLLVLFWNYLLTSFLFLKVGRTPSWVGREVGGSVWGTFGIAVEL